MVVSMQEWRRVQREKETHMRCPECMTRLVYNGHWRYESIMEHCDASNHRLPLRPTFICPNGCINGFYDGKGALYPDGPVEPGIGSAMYSFEWRCDCFGPEPADESQGLWEWDRLNSPKTRRLGDGLLHILGDTDGDTDTC